MAKIGLYLVSILKKSLYFTKACQKKLFISYISIILKKNSPAALAPKSGSAGKKKAFEVLSGPTYMSLMTIQISDKNSHMVPIFGSSGLYLVPIFEKSGLYLVSNRDFFM